MISREYNKRISLYEVTLNPNGFGGNTATEELLFTSWAQIITNGVGYKVADLGLQTFENPILFKVRYRNDFQYSGRTLFAMYKGDKYIIQAIRNVNEVNLELEIYCTKEVEVLP